MNEPSLSEVSLVGKSTFRKKPVSLNNSSCANLQVGKVGKRSAPPLQRSAACLLLEPLSAYTDLVQSVLKKGIELITLRWSGGALRLPTFLTCEFAQLGRFNT